MVYGRLCVVPGEETFLREAILTVFGRSPCEREEIPRLRDVGYTTLRREVYRAQIGSEAGKRLRWEAEKEIGELFSSRYFSRNNCSTREQKSIKSRTSTGPTFCTSISSQPLNLCPSWIVRGLLFQTQGDLLNVTVRNIKRIGIHFFATPIEICLPSLCFSTRLAGKKMISAWKR
jgi:hypothetical protein